MRNAYLITYDISDPTRLRNVFKTMKGVGLHAQYSVFLCELSAQGLVALQSRLEELIDHDADQVLFVDIGPAEGRAANAISYIGRTHTGPIRGPLIA